MAKEKDQAIWLKKRREDSYVPARADRDDEELMNRLFGYDFAFCGIQLKVVLSSGHFELHFRSQSWLVPIYRVSARYS